jgi:hypothetical protein
MSDWSPKRTVSVSVAAPHEAFASSSNCWSIFSVFFILITLPYAYVSQHWWPFVDYEPGAADVASPTRAERGFGGGKARAASGQGRARARRVGATQKNKPDLHPVGQFAGLVSRLGDRTPAMYYRPGRISDVPKQRIEHTGPGEPRDWPH